MVTRSAEVYTDEIHRCKRCGTPGILTERVGNSAAQQQSLGFVVICATDSCQFSSGPRRPYEAPKDAVKAWNDMWYRVYYEIRDREYEVEKRFREMKEIKEAASAVRYAIKIIWENLSRKGRKKVLTELQKENGVKTLLRMGLTEQDLK